jgi:hypothetical protein
MRVPARTTPDVTAGVHDQCFRCQQFFDLIEEEEALRSARNQPRSGRAEDEKCAFDLRRERRDAGVAGCALRPDKRSMCRLRPEAPHRDPCNHQLVRGPQRGREARRIELGDGTFRLVDAPEEEKASNFEIAGVGGVYAVAVLFKRYPCRLQPFRRPAQFAGGKCDLGLGDDASRVGQRLLAAKSPRSTSQESFCPNEVAELRHGNASKCEGRRVVPQGDALQCAEWIADRERSRRGVD